jgi:carboxymethylenebutenolidase
MFSLIAPLAFFSSALLSPTPDGVVPGTGAKLSCCSANMSKFASDPAFLAAHEAPLPLSYKAKSGKDVKFPAAIGAPAHGFYVPPRPGSHSAVILIHEFWGLNDYIKREAERLQAETGYAVMAVDLYDGKVTTDANEASRLMGSVDESRAMAILSGAFKQLRTGSFGFKPTAIGTVGYCFGGGWSHRAAILGGKAVKACVIYYGMPDTEPASLQRLQAPVLMFEGKRDQWINDAVVSKFQAAMKVAGKSLEVHAYDANHAFANPSNPRYDKAAAADSHARELAFFAAHLR